VTDGHLPSPYRRASLTDTLAKATSAGVAILAASYKMDQLSAAAVQFPGDYIAEIHALEQ
jgi:hypothetical protein